MEKDPTEVVRQAVRGMLPVNKLRDARLERLKIYVDDQHKHEAQQPKAISVLSDASAISRKESK
jgi:large subunit ribosomal protein L13